MKTQDSYYTQTLNYVGQNPKAIWDILPDNLSEEQFTEIVNIAVEKDPLLLRYITSDNILKFDREKYYELALRAVKSNMLAFPYVVPYVDEYVEKEYRHQKVDILTKEQYEEIALEAVRKQGNLLRNVKPFCLTKEACDKILRLAIVENPLAIEHVNAAYLVKEQYLTKQGYEEIALLAVGGMGDAISLVDPKFLPEGAYDRVCVRAVNQNPEACYRIRMEHVGPGYWGAVLLAISQDPAMIINVHSENKDEYKAAGLLAVGKDGSLIRHVKPEALTNEQYREVALAAANQNGYALRDVSRSNLTDEQYGEVAMVAVSNDGLALEYVRPDINYGKKAISKKEYEEICSKALEKNSYAIGCVKPEYLPKDVYQKFASEAVRKCGDAIASVDHRNLSKKEYSEIALVAVEQDGLALRHVKCSYVSNKEKYKEIATAAVGQNAKALKFIDSTNLPKGAYEELALLAVEKDNEVVTYVAYGELKGKKALDEIKKKLNPGQVIDSPSQDGPLKDNFELKVNEK